MPREKKYDLEFNKRPEGVAYRNKYRDDHYARMEILIPPELRDRIYAQAEKEGISRTQLLTKAFSEYLDRQDG